MEAVIDIKVIKTEKSKLPGTSLENLPFGKVFTDHMLEVEYKDGQWQQPVIKPFGPISMLPTNATLHYGQTIFEGIKAYRTVSGEPYIFRPFDNFHRFNISAARMMMPEIPEELFIEGMRKLVEVDLDWIPNKPDHSLYIRPFMFATDEAIGVRPSSTYSFYILLSPTGPYYSKPCRIYVEEKYTRAAPGGIGFAKSGGNYASSLLAFAEAQAKGFDQVLWTDAFEHKYVQEMGTMNVFFIIGNTAITPNLEGSILEGVTRSTVITLLQEQGLKVEERPLHIDEIIAAHKAGTLKEAFGTGTAATITPIKELNYKGYEMLLDTDKWTISPEVKRRLDAIREGREADVHQWMFPVKG
ncbi:branched-chain amino acid aminotransferase [Dinghuibacter silviterrae]|uniref:Branched-chain-amino-acid aminotransferase n=1 Tax=Dinghuibacter silviterrae TaxID=1539049 RepID=A0A4R8DRQ3_9BACT|nr:branched-chain amino acid aminotransferase [Dinghuibacter silviterrae]TDX00659.1 branched-chain amino acid aminotransferase [Dinghuibacter silviterrae]